MILISFNLFLLEVKLETFSKTHKGISSICLKMEENLGKKIKVSMNFCEEVNFQTYIELVKQQKMTWNIFENVIKDLSYSDKNKLKILNASLLNELTMNLSEIDQSRYLNSILLTEFKEFIYREEFFQNTANEYFVKESEKSIVDSDWNQEKIKEDTEVKIVEIKENKQKEELHAFSKYNIIESNQITATDYFGDESEKTTVDSNLDEEKTKDDSEIKTIEIMKNGINEIDASSRNNSKDSSKIEPEMKIFNELY